jgi:hypothetical protein
MPDKLDWMNKHFVLLRYLSIAEVVEKENYKIRPDLAELFTGVTGAEEMAYKFAKLEKFKDACELLAYVVHRRAGIWWGYRCVNSIIEELKLNPAVERDIADIGTNFTPTVPDFAKIEVPTVDPAIKAQSEAILAQVRAKTKAARANADPKMLALLEEAVEVALPICFADPVTQTPVLHFESQMDQAIEQSPISMTKRILPRRDSNLSLHSFFSHTEILPILSSLSSISLILIDVK